MLPTCVKKPMKSSKPSLFALALATSLAVAAGPAFAKTSPKPQGKTTIELATASDVVTVSDYEFNTFVLPEPARRIVFPAGTPVTGEPVKLAEGRQVLLQFAKGSDRPIQMVVELESGRVETVRVQPKPVAGVVVPLSGARLGRDGSPRAAAQDTQLEHSPRGADVELLKTLTTTGMPPAGFDPVTLPGPLALRVWHTN